MLLSFYPYVGIWRFDMVMYVDLMTCIFLNICVIRVFIALIEVGRYNLHSSWWKTSPPRTSTRIMNVWFKYDYKNFLKLPVLQFLCNHPPNLQITFEIGVSWCFRIFNHPCNPWSSSINSLMLHQEIRSPWTQEL